MGKPKSQNAAASLSSEETWRHRASPLEKTWQAHTIEAHFASSRVRLVLPSAKISVGAARMAVSLAVGDRVSSEEGALVLESLLGRGAFGEVWRCREVAQDSLRAVKIVPSQDLHFAPGLDEVGFYAALLKGQCSPNPGRIRPKLRRQRSNSVELGPDAGQIRQRSTTCRRESTTKDSPESANFDWIWSLSVDVGRHLPVSANLGSAVFNFVPMSVEMGDV